MHIDVTGAGDHRLPNSGGQCGLQSSSAADSQHDLGGVNPLSEVEDRLSRLIAADRVEASAELGSQLALRGNRRKVHVDQAVGRCDVGGQQLAPCTSGGDLGPAAQEGIPLGSPIERHHHALARRPGL